MSKITEEAKALAKKKEYIELWYAEEFERIKNEIKEEDGKISYEIFLKIRNFKLNNNAIDERSYIKKTIGKALQGKKSPDKFKKLMEIYGVDYPIASAILAMKFPEDFAIIDINVLMGIYVEDDEKRFINGRVKNCKNSQCKSGFNNAQLKRNHEIYKEYIEFLKEKRNNSNFLKEIKYDERKDKGEADLRFAERHYFKVGRNLSKKRKEEIKKELNKK